MLQDVDIDLFFIKKNLLFDFLGRLIYIQTKNSLFRKVVQNIFVHSRLSVKRGKKGIYGFFAIF